MGKEIARISIIGCVSHIANHRSSTKIEENINEMVSNFTYECKLCTRRFYS